MQNHSRFKTVILFSGIIVIAAAFGLFLNAMSVRDFAGPGQDFLSGASNIRLAIAFVLLALLAIGLLVLLYRGSEIAQQAASQEVKREQADATVRSSEPVLRDRDAPTAKSKDSSELLSDTAGELRTSVEVIQEELEEILDEELPADKEQMQSLYEETDRLRKIIEGMEQLSKAQAIARALKKEAVQVEPFLNSVIEKVRASVTDRDVTYSLECEAGLTFTGDPECLSMIIGNIADNAAKSIRGSGTVTLAASRKGADVVFSVKDTGTGIRRSHVSHLYERFFRGSGTGIGMGLAIVKELVDACSGKIDVKTKPGEGSVFTVSMPAP